MRRLYFRIYLAVLGSLALFAMLSGLAWRLVADFERFGPEPGFIAEAAEKLLPAGDAPLAAQQAALDHWRRRTGYDLALFGADGRLIADASDRTLPLPEPAQGRVGAARGRGPFGVHAVQLSDGRWLAAARPPPERGGLRRFGWLAALIAIALAVGICAYPVVRGLTRGLERLQQGVEALGAGDLAARVPVAGRDEVARLAATFNRSAARIESLVRANKSLLANASHELRSPLARLRMAVETLGPDAPEALRAEFARDVKELDELIEEILLASRLDAEPDARAATEAVDIVALAAEECARGGAELDAAAAGARLVRGDERLLRRLLRNLLQNGRRHGGGTPVEVTIRDGPGPGVEMAVCDRGPGVPEAERERIFEPFYRLPGTREREGGAGLGLALVRQIAERHGGTAVCLPRPGGGSCFRVILPVAGGRDQGQRSGRAFPDL